MPQYDALRRLLISLSLANLLALQVWSFIFRTAQEAPLAREVFAGAIVAVLILAIALLAISKFTELFASTRWKSRLTLFGFSVTWILIAWAAIKPNAIQVTQHALGVLSPVVVGTTVAVVIVVILALLKPHLVRAVQCMTLAALVMSPYAALNLVHATVELFVRGLDASVEQKIQVPRLAIDEKMLRTVVLLFDEFDYELAFAPAVRRDALPALDALRSRGLFAMAAYPPMHSTAMSVPAMLTGRLVREGLASNAHPGDLELRFDDGSEGLWSKQQSLFTDLRTAGLTSLRMNDALFPHIRLPGPADADVVVAPAPGNLRTIGDYAADHLISVATLLPFAKAWALDAHLRRLFCLLPPSDHIAAVATQIVDLAGEARSDVIFLHILLPHLPVVFNPAGNEFKAVTSADYRDNFLGVDQVVGRVIERLKERERLSNTNLIVLTDHFYRFKRAGYGLGDHRIPFIALFAGDNLPVGDFDKAFNTVTFRKMVGGIAEGKIRDSAGLARWISSNATFGESPLTEYRKGW